MDTRIADGDFLMDDCGYPISIYGDEERMQIAEITLSAKKGRFKYDRTLGTDRTSLVDPNITGEALRVVCREAFADRDDIDIESVSVELVHHKAVISFTLSDGTSGETEVRLYEGI